MSPWRPPFYWRYTIREVRRRPLRTLLTLVGIVLGVAAVAAASLAEATTREHYAGIYRPVAGRAALEVVPAGGEGTMAPDLAAIDATPGVRAAAPVVFAPTALVTPAGPQALLLLGIDAERDAEVRDLLLLGANSHGLMVEQGFAARNGLAVGKPAKLMTSRGPVEVVVAGLLHGSGPARFNGGAFGVLPLKDAQSLFGTPGEVSAVQLVLEPGADPDRVAAALEKTPPGREVRSPLARGRLGGEFLVSTEQMMHSLSAVAVVAGSMVILNTFLMNLTERRRQLGLLRALGATRRQVTGLVARQALLLGVVGTALGLPVGVGLAAVLVAVQETFLGVPMPRLPLAPGPLLMAGVLGPAMTLLAALVPAGWAAARPPLAAITARGGAGDGPSPWPIGVGLALLLVVAVYLTGVIVGRLPQAVGLPLMPFMAGLGLMALACLLPLLLPAILRFAGWVVPAAFGVEGRLAVRHLQRQRARTGLTVGVLFAAVTACVAFGMSFLVNLRDIERWYAGTIDCDFLVRAVAPDPGLVVTQAPLPSSTAAEISQLPGCDQVSRFRFRPTRVNGVDALAFVREFPKGGPLPLVLDQGDPADARQALARGEAVVGTALANRLGVGVGDEIEVPGRGGARRLRVAGLAKEYTAGGMVFYVDWDQARGWLGDAVTGLAVTARPGEADEFGADLADYCAKNGLLLQRNSDFAATIDHVVAGVRWFVVCMVGLVFLVAAVGVVNTLTTNVLDQTRELGVLRALGMKRGQVGKLVVAQASALALASCLPGAPLGVLMAYLMNLTTPGLLGQAIPFHVEFGFVAACVAGVCALAVLASLLPARRAARLAVIDALRYE